MSISHPKHHCLRCLAWCIALTGAGAFACAVPVFRYALEHWPSDPYQAIVLHRGALSEANQTLGRRLRQDGNGGAPHANIVVRGVDLAQSPSPEMLALWKQAGRPDAPWLVMLPPRSANVSKPVFAAALDEATVNGVIDSPARQKIMMRLGQGESAVWVLLESGDKAQDDAVAKLLETRLAYLGSVLELPKLDQQDIKNGLVSVPPDGLRLAFSVLRVSRADSAEKFFASTLLASESDLKDRAEPIVFPIFGQGRVLYALVGQGIRYENIDKAASFLIGSCSCQVKEQNPGVDLLMAVDWKRLLKDQAVGVQDLPKASDIVGAMPESVTIVPHQEVREPVAHDCCVVMSWVRTHRGLGALVGLAGLLMIGFGMARLLRKRAV